MSSSGHPAVLVLAAVAGLFLLRLNVWRAVLFLRPQSVRVEADTPDEQILVPASLEAAWAALKTAGFRPLGSHIEHPRFTAPQTWYDAVHEVDSVFASVFESRDGQPRVVLLTPTHDGFVLTANYRRVAREVSGYSSGGIEGASVDRLVRVHQRRRATMGAAEASWTLDGRVDAARRWYRGAGKPELRQQHAVGLLWTLGALGMVGAAIVGSTN